MHVLGIGRARPEHRELIDTILPEPPRELEREAARPNVRGIRLSGLRVVDLDRDRDCRLDVGSSALTCVFACSNEGLVDLNETAERLAVRAHHRLAQLVHHRPRRLIRAELEDPLQAQCGDTVLLRADEPARREPGAQRQMRAMKDCPAVTDVLR